MLCFSWFRDFSWVVTACFLRFTMFALECVDLPTPAPVGRSGLLAGGNDGLILLMDSVMTSSDHHGMQLNHNQNSILSTTLNGGRRFASFCSRVEQPCLIRHKHGSRGILCSRWTDRRMRRLDSSGRGDGRVHVFRSSGCAFGSSIHSIHCMSSLHSRRPSFVHV